MMEEKIEDIQRAIVEAGGIFMGQSEIKKMSVEKLLNLLLPNNIEVKIKHIPDYEQVN